MHFEFGFYSSLLLIFFTHLIVYTFLFWRRGIIQEKLSDKLLGTFFLLSALFIFPWMSGFAGWYDNQPYRDILFYTPFIHALFFGPLLYLYLKSLTNSSYTIQKKDLYHFIPGLLYLLWCICMVFTDKVIIGHYYLMNGDTDPDFDKWYSYLWSLSILVYLFLTIRYYFQYLIYTQHELSFAEAASFKWLRNFLYAFSLLTLLLISEQLITLFIDLAYIRSWYYFFAFALITYYMAISAYNNQQRSISKLHFTPSLFVNYHQPLQLQYELPAVEDADYEIISRKKEDEEWMVQWKEKVVAIMEEHKVFLDPELTLTELAKKLNTNPSLLSKVINSCFQVSFNDYVNQFRVQEAILLMADSRYKNLNLLAIAYDAGFNSKSTFNRAFKKVTGHNPKNYLPQS